MIGNILLAHGVRPRQQRPGRSPDEQALRGAFETFFANARPGGHRHPPAGPAARLRAASYSFQFFTLCLVLYFGWTLLFVRAAMSACSSALSLAEHPLSTREVRQPEPCAKAPPHGYRSLDVRTTRAGGLMV